MSRILVVLVWLLFYSTSVQAQNLPPIGSDATLDVATWNIEHFGNDGEPPDDETQIQNAATVIRQGSADLWAVQEIEDEADFDRLVRLLGDGWAGVVDQASSNMHVGFIYKTDVVHVRKIDSILKAFSSSFAGRPPLQVEVDVTLPDTTLTVTFITLHMKCCSDGWARREEAGKRLKNHVDFTHLASRPVVILGDFNDKLTGSITSGKSSPFENLVQDDTRYRFATLDLERRGESTFCFTASCASGSTIDHILITDELFGSYVEASGDRYDEVLQEIRFYTSTTSDHLPVYARFGFNKHTAVEHLPNDTVQLGNVYPNPVSGVASVSYRAGRPVRLSIQIHDALGREVRTVSERPISAGMSYVSVQTDGLAPGTYFLRVIAGDTASVKPFVVAR